MNDHIEQDDHTDNVVEDDGTNTLIHDSFNVRIMMMMKMIMKILMTLMMFMIYLFLRRHMNPFMKALQNKSSLCCIVDNELEGYEWSFKHCNHMDAKVCKIIHHIYRIVIKLICTPLIIVC